MTTMKEEITTERQVNDTPGQRQCVEITNPIYLSPTMTGMLTSYSKDRVSSTMKATNIADILGGWKRLRSKTIDKSAAAWTIIDDHSNTMTGTLKYMTTALIREGAYNLHQSYRWHKQLKYTIYSTFQHQGALMFVVSPFNIGSSTSLYSINRFDESRYINYSPNYKTEPGIWMTQLPHKIVSLGQNSEVIIDLPYTGHYDSIDEAHFDYLLHYVGVYMMDPLQTVEGVADTVRMVVDYKMELETIGANFESSVQGFGEMQPADIP